MRQPANERACPPNILTPTLPPMTRRPALAAVALIAIATLALLACRSSSSGDKTATPSVTTPAATSQATPVPSSTPDERIRDIDLANVADVKKALEPRTASSSRRA